MRKFVCLLLSVALLLSLCACSAKPTEPETPETPSNDEVSDDVYTNSDLGLSYTLLDGWRFYTREELDELSGYAEENAGDEPADRLEKTSVVYAMYATNETGASSINVTVEKISALQADAFDGKALLEAQFSSIRSSFEGMGFADVAVSYVPVTVSGKPFDGAKLEATLNGTDFHESFVLYKKGNYLVNITAAAYGTETSTSAILKNLTID